MMVMMTVMVTAIMMVMLFLRCEICQRKNTFRVKFEVRIEKIGFRNKLSFVKKG